MKDLKCCFGFLFEKYEKISKLEVLIGAQIVGTSAVVDLWVRRTMYPSTYRCQSDHWRKISPSKNCSVHFFCKFLHFFLQILTVYIFFCKFLVSRQGGNRLAGDTLNIFLHTLVLTSPAGHRQHGEQCRHFTLA